MNKKMEATAIIEITLEEVQLLQKELRKYDVKWIKSLAVEMKEPTDSDDSIVIQRIYNICRGVITSQSRRRQFITVASKLLDTYITDANDVKNLLDQKNN